MRAVVRVGMALVAVVPFGVLVDVFRIVVDRRPVMSRGRPVMSVLTNGWSVMAVVFGRRPVIVVVAVGANHHLWHPDSNLDVDISLRSGAEQAGRKGKPKHQQSFHGDPLKTFSLL